MYKNHPDIKAIRKKRDSNTFDVTRCVSIYINSVVPRHKINDIPGVPEACTSSVTAALALRCLSTNSVKTWISRCFTSPVSMRPAPYSQKWTRNSFRPQAGVGFTIFSNFGKCKNINTLGNKFKCTDRFTFFRCSSSLSSSRKKLRYLTGIST